MNRIYNLVFNRALGQVQVVSEFAHRRRGGTARGRRGRRVVAMLSALALGMAGLPAAAQVAPTQLPTGATPLGGIGSITADGAGNMTITQIDERALILWNTFDVGEDATVTFDQGLGDIALNQILDVDASQIFGNIDAAGTIFLINQNGIVFGETAQLNVGGLVASTLSTNTGDFLAQDAGEYVNTSFVFEQTGSPASIINRGNIMVTNGGHAILLGGHVLNDTSGLISAEAGRVDLLGGASATLNLFPGGGFSIAVGDALESTVAGVAAVVENRGELEARGGDVYLHAALASDVLADAVNHSGTIDATGLGALADGSVNLIGSGRAVRSTGDIDSGTVSMTGASGLSIGGSIDTSGDQDYVGAVTLVGDTTLNGGGANIQFGSTVDGGHALAVSAGTIDFGGAVGQNQALSSLSVNASNFLAPALNILGSLSVNTTGSIGQSGAFDVGGVATFNAGNGTITLNDTGNDFGGPVNLTGGTTSILDANALELGTLQTGTLTAISYGSLILGTGDINGSLTADSNGGDISQEGALSVSGTAALDAGTGDVTLADADNDFGGAVDVTGGAISLRDMTDLAVASLASGANEAVTLVAGGALNLGGAAIDTGTADLTLQSGAVLTTTADLDGANVSLQGDDGIVLGADVTATGNLSLTSQDTAIAQTAGAVRVGGETTVDAGTGNVTLAGANNDFIGTVNVIGGAVELTDASALTLGTVTAGELTATSTGDLDLGTTDVSGVLVAHSNGGTIRQGGSLRVGGTTELDAGIGDVTLTDADNDFVGAVDVTGGAISLRDMNDLAVASLANGANRAVTLVAGDALSLGGAAIDTGTADLTLESGELLATTAALRGANVTLQGDGGISLGADVTATGNLSLTSQDAAIAQTAGALWVDGDTTVDAGTGNVTLAGANNDFIGAVNVIGGAVELTDASALTLGTVTAGELTATSTGSLDLGTTDVSGALVATSNGGAITQGGSLRVGGMTELDAGVGDVTLADAGNDFGGAVDVTGGAISLRDMNTLTVASLANGADQAVTLVAGGALNLGGTAVDTGTADLALQSGALLTTGTDLAGANITLQGDGGIALDADVTATGGLSLTSQDAAIVQTGGVVSAVGDTDVNAGTGNVTLANADNDFGGSVDIIGGAVAITDVDDLTLGTVTAGQLTATSVGALDLGTTEVSGALVAHSNGGAIVQGGALQVGGTAELDAGTGDVTLANADNDFGGAVSITGGTVAITDANALALGTVTAGQLTATSTGLLDLGTTDVSGALVAHSNGGAIEQGGALQVGGTTELDAGTGDVTLANAGNDFGGVVNVTGGAISLRDVNTLTVASLAHGANQAVTLVAGEALNLGGTAIDTGTADLALQSGALLTTTVNLGGANVSLQGDGGIALGADVTATGNLSLTSQDAAIMQTGGVVSAGGDTDVDAGTGNVTLASAGNDFGGAVSITGGTVAITDVDDLTLGTVTADQLTATSTGRLDLGTTGVSGALVAHSNGGAIEQGGALLVGGTTELDAGTGDVTLANAGNDFGGAVDVTGAAISLRDVNDLTMASLANGANQAVTLTAGGALNLGGTAIDTGTADLALQSGALLTTTVNLGGANVSLQGDGGIVLGADVTATGDLSLASQDAAIVQTGGVVSVDGDTDVDAGTGNVTLAGAGNDFIGAVDITGDTVAITDANALTLGSVTAGQLTATSTGRLDLGSTDVSGALVAHSNGGAIEQDGALRVGGTTELDAGTGDVTLSNADNDFLGAVDITGATVVITDANALTLGTVTANQLTATSTGRLDLGNTGVSGALVATSNGGAIEQGGALFVGGTTELDAGTGDVTLVNAGNDFTGAVDITGATVAITDANALTLGTVTAGQLTATSTGRLDLGSTDVSGALVAHSNGGAIEQGGALLIGGATELDAGTGDVTLSNADNDFVGAVDITGGAVVITDANALTLGTVTAGQLTATSTGRLDLGSTDVSGALVAHSNGGAIEQDGALRVGGTAELDAGTGDVTLANAGNDFVGAVDIVGGAVAITDANALTLGTVTAGQLTATSTGDLDLGTTDVSGTLVAHSNGGAIEQGGALQVGGTTELDAGTGDVTLANVDNDFVGAVDIVGGAVAITDANALTLGTVAAGQLTATSTGDLDLGRTDVSGALVAHSNGGAIVQGGVLQVGGTTELDAGTGDVTLANEDNDFTGAVDITGGTVAITDANALTLGTVTAGQLTATSTGRLDLGSTDVSGALVAHSNGGAIEQGGALLVGGTTELDAGTGDVMLANADNDFTGAVDITGGSVAINDANALTLGTVAAGQLTATSTGRLDLGSTDVSGALVAHSNGGAIEQGGALQIGGTTELDAGTGDVTLANADNDFVGAVDIVGGAVAITDANALTLGTVTASQLTATNTGDLDLGTTDVSGALVAHSNGGAIEQGGALFVGGTTELDAGAGDVTLVNADNDFAGAVDVTGGAISLRDVNDLAIVALANGANQAVELTAGGALDLDVASIDTGTADLALQSGARLAMTTDLSGANVTLRGDGGIALGGDVTATGDLSLASQDAAIVQTGGALSVGGDTDVDAGAGDVNLAGANNDFTGAVNLIGGAVEIRDANALTLGTVTAGQLTATSTGTLNLAGTVDGGSHAALTSVDGDILIGGTVSAQRMHLDAGGAITAQEGASIIAGTLSGRAGGPTMLGSADHYVDNQVDVLGNFTSRSGFSMTNGRTLTLASVDGSGFTVDAGTADTYLSVVGGDLLQQGTAWLYNGSGTFASTGHIGMPEAPIYVLGVDAQHVAGIGKPPAYFYAVTADGTLLPIIGGFSINVPTSLWAGRAQSSSNRTVAYVDVGADASNYRAYGIVDPGIRLPDDQQPECDPDFPGPECGDVQ